MEDRLDVMIFGASGYTGRFVLAEMFRICKDYPDVRWGIAGRDRTKLEKALGEAAQRSGGDTSPIDITIADADDDKALESMSIRCKVLLNCSGPYARAATRVLRAAVRTSTHYLDVCSENAFLEKSLVEFDTLARERGVFVISACGLGCVPADLGVVYMQQKFPGTLNSVEAYLTTQKEPIRSWPFNVMRDSTWEGLIEGIAAKPLFSRQGCCTKELEPKLKRRSCIHKRSNRWCVPFPGAEESVVLRTQDYIHSQNKRPVQFKRYNTFPNIVAAIATIFAGFFAFFLCKIFFLKYFLIKYPRLFSLGIVTYGDPDEKIMEKLTFEYKMYGIGWKGEVQGKPKDKIVARIYPEGKNAPYEGTAVACVFAALTLLTERDKMPATCGVLTPGAAFKDTSLIEKYNNDKLKFEIVDEE